MRKQIVLFLFSACLIACTHEDKSDALMAVDLSDLSKTETVNIAFGEWAENRPDDWVGSPRLTDLMEMGEMDNPVVVIGKIK